MGDFSIFGLPVSLGTMIYQAAIFTVLIFLLKKYVLKNVVNILEKRKQYIESQLRLAEKYKRDAEVQLAEHDLLIKSAKNEGREILQKSRERAEQIVQDAVEEAAQIRFRAYEEQRKRRECVKN